MKRPALTSFERTLFEMIQKAEKAKSPWPFSLTPESTRALASLSDKGLLCFGKRHVLVPVDGLVTRRGAR